MERNFIVEFNESQQCFHHNYGNDKPNTHGWVTIKEDVSDFEYMVYKCFVDRVKKRKLTIKYLLQCLKEYEQFMDNLEEKGLVITFDERQ